MYYISLGGLDSNIGTPNTYTVSVVLGEERVECQGVSGRNGCSARRGVEGRVTEETSIGVVGWDGAIAYRLCRPGLACGAVDIGLSYSTLVDAVVVGVCGGSSSLRKRSGGHLSCSSRCERGDSHGDDTSGRGNGGSSRRTLGENAIEVNLLRHRASSSIGCKTSEESSPERHCCVIENGE